jgi:tetratricopeptide (TPR) repeat protein
MKRFMILIIIILTLSCSKEKNEIQAEKNEFNKENNSQDYQAISLTGIKLIPSQPSQLILDKVKIRKERYEEDMENIDHIIWYGRFLAYAGEYKKAIQVYSDGLEMHPNDPRLYRHRGHRYITLRQFDSAISDFKKAAQLIQGKPDQIEPDGMPNRHNIPVSSLHTNIWYHFGLAHYLKGDYISAIAAYQRGYLSVTNDDMRVAFTHWMYMSFRRIGDLNRANSILTLIKDDMAIYESYSYHKLCLLYKGNLKIDQIQKENLDSSLGAQEAMKYGIANWHYYNGQVESAKSLMDQIITGDSWSAFGYIAAEADLAKNAEF